MIGHHHHQVILCVYVCGDCYDDNYNILILHYHVYDWTSPPSGECGSVSISVSISVSVVIIIIHIPNTHTDSYQYYIYNCTSLPSGFITISEFKRACENAGFLFSLPEV